MLDQIDMDFYRALAKSWRAAPPQRRVLAAFAGYKAPKEPGGLQARSAPGPASPSGGVNVSELKSALGMF